MYKLALNLKEHEDVVGDSSTAVNGGMRLWDIIWKANVPQNIRICAWRATSNSLTVQVSRVMHHQSNSGMCSICGTGRKVFFMLLGFVIRLMHRRWLRETFGIFPGKSYLIFFD